MALVQTGSKLIICVENKLLIYNKSTNVEQSIDIPKAIIPSNLTPGQKEVLQTESRIATTACESPHGAYFAIATQNKQVVVYKNFTVFKNFTLNRVASKLRFTPANDLLIADKTGDAYLYKLETDESILILGHLSMLLDILMCGKYIVTCDRDEKIRVSHFPNAYNIASYCLGHTKCVTNIECVDDVLISASGDGTIRFWDYLNGEQLHMIDTNCYIEDKSLIERFCQDMDEENCEVISLPITNMQVFQSSNIYIAVSLFNCKSLQIYSVCKCKNEIKSSFIQKLSLDSVPITFSLNKDLFILTNDAIRLFCLTDNKYKLIVDDALNSFYVRNKYIMKINACDISQLFKKKFDNVQEYLDRKKQRIGGK